MSDLQKGTTFSDSGSGAAVNADRLNSLVDSATIQPGIIGDKGNAGALADGDRVLLLQASSGALRSGLLSALLAYIQDVIVPLLTNAPLVQVYTGSAEVVAHRTDRFLWIKTKTGQNTGKQTLLWDDSNSIWRPMATVPLGTIVEYAGSTSFLDGTGLGIFGSALDGWALCNGNNGTVNKTTLGTFIQYIGL